MIRCFTALAFAGCLLSMPPLAAQNPYDSYIPKVAEAKAKDIAKKVRDLQAGRQFKVAILPFGDAAGKSTPSFGNVGTTIQGELIAALLKEATAEANRFSVLTANQAEVKFGGLSLDGFGGSAPKITVELLQKSGIDVAVVGSVEMTGAMDLTANAGSKKSVQVKFKLWTATAEVAIDLPSASIHIADILANTGTGPLNPGGAGKVTDDILNPAEQQALAASAGRFNVEILDESGAVMPLSVCKDRESEYHNAYWLILPKELRSKKTPYKIRVSNRGTPALVTNSKYRDEDRLYAAAVLVDGINSVFQPAYEGGEPEPTIRHASNTIKWVLTGPGRRLRQDKTQPETKFDAAGRLITVQGAVLEPESGAAGSTITVKGFQIGTTTARQFLFTDRKESLAVERRMYTNDVGLIAVHFYPQIFPESDNVGDWLAKIRKGNLGTATASNAGTGIGLDFRNPTYETKFDLDQNPIQVWRIFYRFADEPLPLKSDGAAIILQKVN